MRQSRTYGSVGAPGRQLPGATRRPFVQKHPIYQIQALAIPLSQRGDQKYTLQYSITYDTILI